MTVRVGGGGCGAAGCGEMRRELLTKYEVTRVVGMRSLQLAEGSTPLIHVMDEGMRCDSMYVASLEMWERKLKAKVKRGDGSIVNVWEARFPNTLQIYLDTRDGGDRYGSSSPLSLTVSGLTT